MAHHRSHHLSPTELDIHDPEFCARWHAWAAEAQGEMIEAIAAAKETIAASKTLLAKWDRAARPLEFVQEHETEFD